jgi:predicted acetyltransferase
MRGDVTTSTIRVGTIAPDQFLEYVRVVERAFGRDATPDDEERERVVFEIDRSIAAYDGDDMVGTGAIYSLEMSLPGAGDPVPQPVAGVTSVGVLPTHRRRGVLTAMMRSQLHGLHESQREPVAALYASEAPIYGRFGYGMTGLCATFTFNPREVRLNNTIPLGSGILRLVPPDEARPDLEAVYDVVRRKRVGHFRRTKNWWDRQLIDNDTNKAGFSSLTCVVSEDAGVVDGYVLYRTKPAWADGLPGGQLRVVELFATNPGSYAGLWRYILGVDLMSSVTLPHRPLDDPLLLMLADVQRAHPRVGEQLWVRVVDVDRALASRGYQRDIDVVLDVRDEMCPWNAGRWRLVVDSGAATCARTDAPAALSLDVTSLGAAYLGGVSLVTLAGAGLVDEHSSGSLRSASAAFLGETQPHCPQIF